ncbi:MAG: hypothetical protein LBL74_00275 [Bacteroidales bacterium]|jgi:hypothetical protein|nr:hypothetical protein [Bacteroidales bacterium]
MKIKKTTIAALCFCFAIIGALLIIGNYGNKQAIKDVEEYQKTGISKYEKEYSGMDIDIEVMQDNQTSSKTTNNTI